MNEKWLEQFTANRAEPTADNVVAIEIDRVKPNPFQPRRDFSKAKIDELAQSIKSSGLIQPIVVRRAGNDYQLVVGERRYMACKNLGWEKISAAVRNLSDNEMATLALIENLHRESLSFFEEAAGYSRLLKNFKLTQEELAGRLGKTQSTVANKIRLLKLSPGVQNEIERYGLSERHARALLKLSSEQKQLKIIREIAEKGLTVNQAEKKIDGSDKINDSRRKTKRPKPIIKDMRIVLNTIRKAVEIIQSSGLYPEVEEVVEADYIEVNIRLTKEMLSRKGR